MSTKENSFLELITPEEIYGDPTRSDYSKEWKESGRRIEENKTPEERKADNVYAAYFWLLVGTFLIKIFPLEFDHPIRSLFVLGILGISFIAIFNNLLLNSTWRIFINTLRLIFYIVYIKFLFF